MRGVMRGVVVAAALMVAAGAAHAAPKAEKALGGTSWAELGVFQHLDTLAPEARAAMTACSTPTRTFEMRGDYLVQHHYLSPDGYDTLYVKSIATKDDKGTKFELFTADSDVKPADTFLLLKDGETLMSPGTLFDNGLVKCHSVETPIPAPRPATPRKGPR